MFAERTEPGLPPRSSPPGRATTARRVGVERRGVHRARALLSGKVIVGNGSISADCIIRDLTRNGARVRISRGIGLPEDVALLVIKDGLLFEASVIWRRGDELGLVFNDRRDLRRDSDPSRMGVRALWASLAPR
jgi:hypothetical protein